MKENTIRYCEVCGRSSEDTRVSYWKKFDKTLCAKHYNQLKTYGKILKRTEKDSNEIIKYEDYAEMIVYNKVPKGEKPTEKCRTIIDLDDIDRICLYKWKVTPQGYIFNYKVGLLSRYLLDMKDYKIDKLEVDHIDNNPLNNRKCNLRKATSQQQKQNIRKLKKRTSIYKGVLKYNKSNKWMAKITKSNIVHKLGIFKTEEEAALAYNKMALELFGEFANLNIIDDQYLQSQNKEGEINE